jgi:hypothetical protein
MPHVALILHAGGNPFTMTTRKFKTQLQFLLKRLLPANTRPRKMASQLRRRIKDPHADYRLYKEEYQLYEEANPPETARTRKDKLKIVFWIVIILLTGVFMFYFASQVPLCTEFGCP